MSHERRTTTFKGTLREPGGEVDDSYCCGSGRAWITIPLGAALAGLATAFLRHRRS